MALPADYALGPGALTSLPAISITLAVLLDTEVLCLCPPESEWIGVTVLCVCLAAAHGAGYWILAKRQEIQRRTRVAVERLLPGAELDNGLGFVHPELRGEFMVSVGRLKLWHDVLSAVLGALCPAKDLLLWYQGELSTLPGWVWMALAVFIPAVNTARIFTPHRSTAAANAVMALTVIGYGIGASCSLTWRAPAFRHALLVPMEIIAGTSAMLSLLPLGPTESWVAPASYASLFFVGLCASCVSHWHEPMPWTEVFHPSCPHYAPFVPVFAVPTFLAVCVSCTVRTWVQFEVVMRFAASKHAAA